MIWAGMLQDPWKSLLYYSRQGKAIASLEEKSKQECVLAVGPNLGQLQWLRQG